ncbi:nSTAND1 domain-containing NTPase [Microcystis aeruginosa]|uniref:NACHT domain-containing protein n=1 Tax=Microcystis aeruginosa FD4 TaxID=2686288 RepID=A0A857D3P3_MICAE|nr:WD40 repeat domain-containing protein [Microcystis aeruginosa]QGZ89939.1 NACHT domain-containing protein [Microcystis aeruginosa FD4]
MSESIFRSHFQAEKQVIQQGDNNTQNIIVKTEINYGDDPEEEKVAATINENSPYLGLVAFTANDANLFYGRKKVINDLLKELEKENLIFLLGASGSGKSSLVQAGLIPALSAKYKPNFSNLSMVPNDDPFFSFYLQVANFISQSPTDYKQSETQVALPPQDNITAAVEYLEKVITTLKKKPESLWLIFIDQFEEILTQSQDNKGCLFIQSLENLISYLQRTNNSSVKIVLTMRTDFLDQFMHTFPDFVVTIQSDGRKPFSYITPMADRELKLVIKNPAATHGVNVDLNLIEKIIEDFRGESRSLPLLQYTLDLLWQKDDLSDRLLDYDTYKNLGGVGGALQQQAEKIYQHFESQGQGKAVESIFVQLVTITSDGKRVSKRKNKSGFNDELGKIVDELVKKYRLLVSGRQEGMVEIAHEALIGSWQRLQDWITKYEKEIILERQLKEAAESWWKDKADEKKAISELWTGSKLTQVSNLLKAKSLPDLNALRNYFGDVTVEFMRASREYQQRLQKAEAERKQREVNTELSLANSLSGYSLYLFNEGGKDLEAFVEAIKAGKILQKHNASNTKVIDALQKILVEGREYNRLKGHDGSVYSVSFSSDGKTLATGSGDNTIKLWNVETGQEIRTLTGHNEGVNSVSFSSDGKTLATGSFEKTIKLWNLETGQEIRTLFGHTYFYSVSFSPDGKTLASGSFDGTIKLWNVETGQEIRTLSGHNGASVYSVSFSPDGKTLATGSRDDTIKLWNVETGQEIRTLSGHNETVNSVSFSPDGKTLATGSEDKTIKLWNVETGEEIRTLTGHNEIVNSVSFSSDGKTLATGSYDRTIKLWDVETGQEIRTLSGHNETVNSVSFSPDGKTLATGSWDNTIKLWDVETGQEIRLWNVETGQEIRTLSGHNDASVYSVSFSPDGKTLATGSDDKTIKLWNVETGEEIRTLTGHNGYVNSVSFSNDGKTLATGSSDNTIKLWNVETGQEIRTLTGHNGSVTSVSFSSDGKTLATGSWDNTIKLWNVETGQEIRTLTGHNSFYSVSFSPDGKTLATGSEDNTIKLWNVETGQEIRTLTGHNEGVKSVSFSSDGKTLATGSYGRTIKLWDVETGQEIRTLSGHNGSVYTVSFSNDGKTLATGSWDSTIKLWNVETGKEIRTLSGHNGSVYTVSFSPDGKTLATGSHDKTIKLWNGEYGWGLDGLMGRSCAWVRAYLHNPNSDVREEDRHLCDGIGTKN